MTLINYYGPINRLGYGQASMGYAYGLIQLFGSGNVSIQPIGDIDPSDPEMSEEPARTILSEIGQAPDPTKPTVGFWHFQDIDKIGPGSPRLGISTFEVTPLPKDTIDKIQGLDIVGTASSWGIEELRKQLPADKPLVHAPHAFKLRPNDTIVLPEIAENLSEYWSSKLGVNFSSNLRVFSSSGKFEMRKGHAKLIDALIELSCMTRPILLLACWHNPFLAQGLPFMEMHRRNMVPIYNTPRLPLFSKGYLYVLLVPPVPARQNLHNILLHSHSFVAPSYAEGWNLPLFEMMSMGHHCIATLNTGHLDYCTPDNVTPIYGSYKSLAIDGVFFRNPEVYWDEVTIDGLLEAIRVSMQMLPADRQSIGQRARKDLENRSWVRSSEHIRQALNMK